MQLGTSFQIRASYNSASGMSFVRRQAGGGVVG